MPNPADVLAKINVGNMVKKEYRDQYKLGDNDELWDPKKDWIRTVDWEAVRKEHAGKTVRFAIGAADRESAQERIKPFARTLRHQDRARRDSRRLHVRQGRGRIPFRQRRLRRASSSSRPGSATSRAQGFLKPLDEYVAKWNLPFDDFYETYQLTMAIGPTRACSAFPSTATSSMVHMRPSIFKKVLGSDVDRVKSIPTYDEMIRLAPELNKAEQGVNAIGMMCGRGFWATYTWEHIAAQYGLQLFDDNWEPIFNDDAGVKGLETILALSKHAIEGVAAADWPTNRAAWLGGQVACNISWQDSGTQATRADQSKIGDDVVTIYEPRVAGGPMRRRTSPAPPPASPSPRQNRKPHS